MHKTLGLKERDKNFIKKWSVIRKKGKLRYVLTRGLSYGIFLFFVWFVVTFVSINTSEFEQAIYSHEFMLKKSIAMFIVYLIAGIIFGMGSWKAKEEKFNYLT